MWNFEGETDIKDLGDTQWGVLLALTALSMFDKYDVLRGYLGTSIVNGYNIVS